MDTTAEAVSRVLEAAKALIEVRDERLIQAVSTADSCNIGSDVRPVPQIVATAREEAFGSDHGVRFGKLAAWIAFSPDIKQHRAAVIAGLLLMAFGFGAGWLIRSSSNLIGLSGSSVPAALPSAKPSAAVTNRASAPNVRTVSQDVPIEGRALLDTIAGSESAYSGRDPYRVIYGGGTAENLADHPRQYVPIASGPNIGQKTSAAGRYQYLGRSWDKAKEALGLVDFSPDSQDKAAFWEAQRTYRAKTGRDLVADIQEADGDPQKLAAIGRGISTWWTSLPGGIEPNKATASFGDRFAQNLFYYRNSSKAVVRYAAPPNSSSTNLAPRSSFSPRAEPAAPDSAGPSRGWLAPLAASTGPSAPDAAGATKLAALAPIKPSKGQQPHAAKPNQRFRADATHDALAISPERPDTRNAGPGGATKANRVHDRQTRGSQITTSVSLPKKRDTASLQEPISADRPMLSTEPAAAQRPTTIEGWTVTDVIGGMAVLEGANGTLNAMRGDVVPGVGKINSIVRWGNRWIVATDRGLISMR